MLYHTRVHNWGFILYIATRRAVSSRELRNVIYPPLRAP